MKEIGSEFWSISTNEKKNDLEFLNLGDDYRLLMSGRTAIDCILNEISDDRKIVYMPNYCCDSMLQPFVDNDYKIEYYNVDIINKKYDIDISFDCSIFFAMSYFGYNESNMDKYIEMFSKRKIIVIEDITHRLLSDVNHCSKSDYLIGSLRKWFPLISGGIAINVNGKFKRSYIDEVINEDLVNKRLCAMNLKRDYMVGKNIEKSIFLDLYSQANHMFKCYKNKKIDDISMGILKAIDVDEIKSIRRGNCKLIEQKLKDNRHIKLLYKFDDGDCPLFVPIIINNRDKTKNKLINNSIYLPIHWQNTNSIPNEIYDKELSLIIDQRYNDSDINEYIDKLIKIVGD